MLLQNLPYEMTDKILNELSCADLARFKCVSKEGKRVADRVRGPLMNALNSPLVPVGITPTINPSRIFRYQRSLDKDEDIEYWTQRFKDPFQSVVRSQLVKRFKRNNSSNHDRVNVTSEQRRVVNTEPDGGIVMVQAYAGTGKTTTLFHYAQRWTERKILYLAYNKLLADESKKRFESLPNVHVTTIHALALQHVPVTNVGNLSLKHVKELLGMASVNEKTRLVLNEFGRYCSSDTLDPSAENEQTQTLWARMFESENIKVAHDAYLKLFQMSRPTLHEYDVIMLDEVQDCTDCILDIVLRQTHATRLFVGDVYQKIYGFRHVGNPFEYIQNHSTQEKKRFHYLSISFRFGYDLMQFTNTFLQKKYNEHKGFSSTKSRHDTKLEVNDVYFPNMVTLCRFNISVLKLMFELTQQDHYVCILGKVVNFDKEIQYAQELLWLRAIGQGEGEGDFRDRITVQKIGSFDTLQNLYEHHQAIQNTKWKNRVILLETYGDAIVDHWIQAKAFYRTHDAVFITTAHQSKGSEYDHVRLHDDFNGSSEDAHNTLYVAMTRAKQTLYLNTSLFRFFDKHTPKLKYVFDTKHSKKQRLCGQCQHRFTNHLVCSENDPVSLLRGLECELFDYVPICSFCVLLQVSSGF